MPARKHRLYICVERYCYFDANIWSSHHAIVEDMSQIARESAWTSCINHKILLRKKVPIKHYSRYSSPLSTSRRSACLELGLNCLERAVCSNFMVLACYCSRLSAHLHMIMGQQNDFRDRTIVNYHSICTPVWVPCIYFIMWLILSVIGDDIWAHIPWF